MGLHREGGRQWGLSAYERSCEGGPGVLCIPSPQANQTSVDATQIYGYDRISSFSLGRPPVIHDEHCDVALPTNIDLADFGGTPKPLNEVTSSSQCSP